MYLESLMVVVFAESDKARARVTLWHPTYDNQLIILLRNLSTVVQYIIKNIYYYFQSKYW